MKQTVSFYDFERAFRDYGREGHFSYDALETLFNRFEEVEEETGIEFELDVIAICSDWEEYENLAELNCDKGTYFNNLEELEEVTTVLVTSSDSLVIVAI